MTNQWFFKWHSHNIPGRVVDVENFNGGRIYRGGVEFAGQGQQIFWQCIKKYLSDKIHETYSRWAENTKHYPIDQQRNSLESVHVLLSSFAGRIIEKGHETDRALRGRGDPRSVTKYDSGAHAHVNAELFRLNAAFASLLDTEGAPKLSPKQRVENFLTSHKGILSLIALLVAILFGALKLVFG